VRDTLPQAPGLSLKTVVRRLLAWFAGNARDLPWRRTRDPYAIWVSEVMLQQTQVRTVEPYWRRWMKELPTVRALAAARPERVLKLWEGLGYYARARNLQRAAQVILREHGGDFPSEFDQVLALPGIGRYTAGAICSIAFNQPRAALDGNVARVLSRVLGMTGDLAGNRARQSLWEIARRFVECAASTRRGACTDRACGALNEALMELGAVVCLPRNPACEGCPLNPTCEARRRGVVHLIPAPRRRPTQAQRRVVAIVAHRQGRFLVRQRPEGSVNARLWEFPNAEVHTPDSDPAAVIRSLFGRSCGGWAPLCVVTHSITRYRIRMEVYQLQARASGNTSRKSGRWLTLRQMQTLAFTAAHRRIVRKLSETAWSRRLRTGSRRRRSAGSRDFD
jgi:A/G-specific adenine glycosylase